MKKDSLFHSFSPDEISGISLPDKFTFPFFYQPHPLAEIASSHLQEYLKSQTDFIHNFGLDASQEGMVIGKMFGVLIVQNENNEIGFLAGFSGKLGGTNDHTYFVPPVFDMLTEESFFLKKVQVVNQINKEIETINLLPEYTEVKQLLESTQLDYKLQVDAFKVQLKLQKQERKQIRIANKELLTADEFLVLEADLVKQSLRDKHQLNVLIQSFEEKITSLKSRIQEFEDRLEFLKEERKNKSAALQQELFKSYSFLNAFKESKSLYDIFKETIFLNPPAAAGECATPKLLQYAYLNNYKPLAMAEFWWGASPKSEVRQHGNFYPACTGKCEPILKHMLKGIQVDDNPFLKNFGEDKKLEIIYEDDAFVVVNKPNDLLTVPGINVQDSVYFRLKAIWQTIEPLIIHRLDMPTSGLLVVAKTKEAHKNIQRQFLNRKVNKRYTAILSKEIDVFEGKINLPLILDIINRPMQKVCFEEGKKAITQYKVIEKKNGKTKIHFWPLTGRTHQLRMHSAHHLGLGAPIVGDDLYGLPSDRLYLHAGELEFLHPITNEVMSFSIEDNF